MADQLRLRGGSTSTQEMFTGAEREISVDTDLKTIRVHDGETPGGHLLLRGGSCLEISDPADPCKVTVNGDLDVNGGEISLDGNVHIDGNLVVDGNFIQDGITLAVKSDEVILTNPGSVNTPSGNCNHLPASGNLQTQEHANQYIYSALKALEDGICDFDEVIELLKEEISDIEDAIKILEAEIEKNQDDITDNAVAIAKLEKDVEQLQKDLEEINTWIKEHSLEDHVDVDLAAPSEGDFLVYKNGKWTNDAPCIYKCNNYIQNLVPL